MTAASIELLTGARAALLLRGSINMDVVWSVLHVLGQYYEARAIILPSPEDASFCPVGPEDVLLEDGHGVRVLNALNNHLSVLTGEGGPLDLISVWGSRGVVKCKSSIVRLSKISKYQYFFDTTFKKHQATSY